MGSFSALLLFSLAAVSPGTEPVAAEDVVELPAEVPDLVTQRLAGTRSDEQRLRRLFDFVFEPTGVALQYGGEETQTVAQTLQTRQANCLSFSLLFVALARDAGLDAHVQEMEQVLVWQEHSGLAYNTGHVNALVRIGAHRFSADINRSLLLASSTPRVLTDAEALARYYNNRGVELMAAGRLPEAARHFAQALQRAPEFAGLHNNLGVLASRENRLDAAQAHFEFALAHHSRNAAALFNLVALQTRRGNPEATIDYQARLDRLQRHDPFHQYLLGERSERSGELATALAHYRRAVRLQPDQHLFHFALARTYAQLGDSDRARVELGRARDLADAERRPLYQAKIDGLQRGAEARR